MREVANTQEEFNELINDYKSLDWKLVEEKDDKAVLKLGLRGIWGFHIVMFLLLPIVGNIIFSLYRRMGDRPKKCVIRLKKD